MGRMVWAPPCRDMACSALWHSQGYICTPVQFWPQEQRRWFVGKIGTVLIDMNMHDTSSLVSIQSRLLPSFGDLLCRGPGCGPDLLLQICGIVPTAPQLSEEASIITAPTSR